MGTWTRFSSGSAFESTSRYSRVVTDGEWVLVAGTTGFDYATMTIAEDVATQARRTFANIGAALEQAGSSLAEVVRFTLYLASAELLEPVSVAMAEAIDHRPVGTAVVTGFIDPRILVEVEVTARRGATFVDG